MTVKIFNTFAVCILSALAIAGELTFDFKCNKSKPFAKAGETIIIMGQVLQDGKPAAGQLVTCYFTFNEKTVKMIKKTPADKPYTFEYTPEMPGWLALRIYAVDKKGKNISLKVKRGSRTITKSLYGGYGVMIDAEKLTPSVPEPSDFDEYWNKVKEELAAVPMKEIEKRQVANKNVDIFPIMCYTIYR